MGYYVDYGIDVTFKTEDEPAMLAAINALHAPELVAAQANGGSWSGGECKQKWYSWVGNPPEGGFTTLEEAMLAWRFDVFSNQFSFTGGKLGQEETLFVALAPWLEGEIYARGEDDCEWGYRFKEGRMRGLTCNKTWTED